MPDLRSEIQKVIPSLSEAQKPKPLTEQVWLLLKDHPWWNSKRLAATLRLPRQRISGVLTSLSYRGMIVSRPSQARHASPLEKEWSTPPGMTVFEWLPVLPQHLGKEGGNPTQKAELVAQKQQNVNPAPDQPRPPAPAAPPTPGQQWKGAMTDEELRRFVDDLPLADAKRIRKALNELFKED